MSITTKQIAIKDLILWDENARFPDKYYNSDEKELIKYFLSNPKFEMKKFIGEIVKEFNLPQLEKLVVWDNENNLIVIEGNRRLTAFKLLLNPDHAANANSWFNWGKSTDNNEFVRGAVVLVGYKGCGDQDFGHLAVAFEDHSGDTIDPHIILLGANYSEIGTQPYLTALCRFVYRVPYTPLVHTPFRTFQNN